MRKLRQWWRDNALLIFAQGIVGAFRGFFRIQEALAPPEKQAKLRQLRGQLDHLEKQKQEILKVSKERSPDGTLKILETLERFEKEHGTPDDVARTRGFIDNMRALDSESAALKRLRDETEGDPEREVEAMREYCAGHPDSRMGSASLIGALRKARRFDDAIAVAENQIELTHRDTPEDQKASQIFMTEHCIATLFLEKGEAQEAILRLEKLIATQKKNDNASLPLAYLSLGDAYQKRGAIPEAKKAWKEALRYDDYGVIKMEVAKRLKEISQQS